MTEIWVALILYTTPVMSREIHKEFTTEVQCWDYYQENGERLFGRQHRDHQGNKPGKDFHFRLPWLNYPIRTYAGLNNNTTIWLTCTTKARVWNN